MYTPEPVHMLPSRLAGVTQLKMRPIFMDEALGGADVSYSRI